MSIKEKFNSAFGMALGFHHDDIITMGASRHTALVETDSLKVKKFQPFSLLSTEVDYLVYTNGWGFKADYIKKSVEVLNPNEYAVYYDYNKEDKEEQPILALRNNKYAILIGTKKITEDEKNDWKFEKFKDCIKKAPKSVFSL